MINLSMELHNTINTNNPIQNKSVAYIVFDWLGIY